MAFDFQGQLNTIVEWCKQYWYVIVLVATVVILLILVFKSRKPSLKPVSRSEIERKQFIDRNRMNKSPLNWLWRGDKLMGKIIYLRATDIINAEKEKDKEKISGIELVIKPSFLGLKFPDIFSKEFCIIVNKDNTDYSLNDRTFNIKESATFEKLFGIYYDRDSKESWVKYIRDSHVYATDWESMSSVYYVKSMEQATFKPENATAIQEKQLDLEAEKEKRKHLVS